MFAANATGTIQRIVHDNGKSGKDAMMKVVLAVPKRFAKDPKESKNFPLFVLWGYDADYMRKYVGVGQPVAFMDCELEVFKNENRLDQDDNPIEQVSYRVGKASFFKADILKALVEAGVAEEAEGGDNDDDDDDRSSRRKKKSSSSRSERRGSSSSKSRGRSRDEEDDEDEDDDKEEEAPRRKKSSSSSRDKKPARKAPARKSRDDDDDDDDDDDNYFDDED